MRRWALALAAIGCGGGNPAVADLAAPPDLAAAPDLAPPADLGPVTLAIGATDGMLTLVGSDVTITGAGKAHVGDVAIDKGAGTIVFDGRTVPAAVYAHQLFADKLLYQTLAVEKDRVWVSWFYCNMDGTLANVYYEATDGTPVSWEFATGTCADDGATTSVAARFPATAFPPPPLLDGYTITGAAITLDGAKPGSILLGGTRYDLYAFNDVDCTVTCGTPGWTELHALLWDAAAPRLGFAILYLTANDTQHVGVSYGITLPGLVDPGHPKLVADWTLPMP